MVQNNKVLTVSYGTFSCTLEGFDDSFETMKAIAEYFRDLAADDRYFGSEPPQPDAEMLTRIAQRDASRRVEAKQSDTGLLLRATDETPAKAPQPTAPVAETPAPSNPDLSVVETASTAGAAAFFADAELVEPSKPLAADSIAAKLQRIRAVVSHSDEHPAPYSEDEENGFLATPEPQVDAISAAFEAGALNPADLEAPVPAPRDEAQAEEAEEPADEPATSHMTDDTETEEVGDATAEEAAEAVAEQAQDEPVLEDAEDTAEELVDDLMAIEPEAEIDADQPVDELVAIETDVEEVEVEAEESSNEVLFAELEDEPENENETDEILNILDEDSSEEPEEDNILEVEEGVLTASDEENILKEISEIESEMEKRGESEQSGSHDIDSDVFRLMDMVGAQMDDPAATDTRETYSHLRTAVAATEAERSEKGDTQEAENQKYRGDLASVVSPRRPEIQVTSMRPESDSTAPLKLVAEQRVDTGKSDTGPVIPRRVTTAQEEDTSEEGGFAHFAQQQGAQSLPDLLEAAASYLSFIEGQEQFSRPQLMNKVRSLKQDEFNREESLRSFGQLLRDGKIEKAGGGRFAASNQIGFRPDDERAAG